MMRLRPLPLPPLPSSFPTLTLPNPTLAFALNRGRADSAPLLQAIPSTMLCTQRRAPVDAALPSPLLGLSSSLTLPPPLSWLVLLGL